MGLFLLLSAVGLAIWTSISRLQARVTTLERQMSDARAFQTLVQALGTRVAALETRARPEAGTINAPTAPVAPPTPVEAPETPIVVTDLRDTIDGAHGLQPVRTLPGAEAPGLHGQPSLHTGVDMPSAVVADAVVPLDGLPPDVTLRPSATPPEPASETWELVVGTSWLNKIGVLIFVTGLALLLGYSMTHVGPAGRVLIGFLVSGAMLGVGVAFERRPPYRPFGLGLVAGGWAGAYVTAFAMHAVPAARIVESDAIGLLALLAVAGGMVGHSLRYRSEALTSLAYTAAFLPVAITPLTTFSLVATLPLVASLLAVAQRLGWSMLSILGLVSTYGLFALRGHVLPGTPLDGSAPLPYLILGAYWLTFEAADIAGARRARTHGHTPAPLFAANAAGYLGAFVAVIRVESSTLTAIALLTMAVAYLGSAVVRARIGSVADTPADTTPAFTTVHAALWLSAALTAWSIDVRMEGPRETLLLLIEAELLIAAALALGDRQIRRIGTALAGLVSAHALAVVVTSPDPTTIWNLAAWTPTVGLVATTWYVNREWLRRRGVTLDPVEQLYTWTASAFVGLIIAREFGAGYEGLAGLVAAMLWSEAGRRQRPEYAWQSRLAILLSVPAVLGAFLPGTNLAHEVWFVLPAAAILGYLYAWRHTASSTSHDRPASDIAAAFSSCAGAAFIALLEWHVFTGVWVLAAWALTALVLTGIGARFRQPVLRWQSYGLAALTAVPGVAGLLFDMRMDHAATTSLLVVIASLFATGYIGRRAATSGLERFVTGLVAFAGTGALTLFKWRVLPREALAPAWAAEALVLVWLGSVRHRAGQRWQGYAAALLALSYSAYWSNQTIALARRSDVPVSWFVLVATIGVIVSVYGVAALARTRKWAADEQRTDTLIQLEAVPFVLLPALASYVLVAFELQWFNVLLHPFVVGATAGGLLAAGLAWTAADVRVQSYVTFAVSGLLTSLAIVNPNRPTSLLWTSASIGLLFATSLVVRQPLARVFGDADAARRSTENAARVALAILGALLATQLIAMEFRPSLVTMGWGLEGTALLFVGFVARERALRLSGLALLFLCILKLFLYDLRELEALARILSFVALGLVLLGVSWTYTTYKDNIRKLL